MRDSLRRLEGTGPAREGEGAVLARVRTANNLEEVDFETDLVVESIPEVLGDKQALLRRIEDLVKEATIVVSNTSSLPLTALAEGLRRPHRFAGYHWFNPPELVELVEVIPAPPPPPEVIGTLVDWSTGIGKHPVAITREIEGFVANRLQYALIREAYALVERGVCSMEDVDAVVRTGLGPRWSGRRTVRNHRSCGARRAPGGGAEPVPHALERRRAAGHARGGPRARGTRSQVG